MRNLLLPSGLFSDSVWSLRVFRREGASQKVCLPLEDPLREPGGSKQHSHLKPSKEKTDLRTVIFLRKSSGKRSWNYAQASEVPPEGKRQKCATPRSPQEINVLSQLSCTLRGASISSEGILQYPPKLVAALQNLLPLMRPVENFVRSFPARQTLQDIKLIICKDWSP